jgi:asparaginyl-tRNA synthetase
MGPLQIKEILQTAPENQSVVVKGWVRTKRESKNAIFIALNDGSTIHNIQAVAEPGQFSAELLLTVTTGSCLKVTGQLIASQGSGQTVEVKITDIEVYGTADPEEYPLATEKAFAGIPARDRPPAPAYEHIQRDPAYPPRIGVRSAPVLQ